MDKISEESSSADSAVDIPKITPLALTSLSPRTPRSQGSMSRSDSEGEGHEGGEGHEDEEGAVAEPEDDRPKQGLVRRRVNDVSK